MVLAKKCKERRMAQQAKRGHSLFIYTNGSVDLATMGSFLLMYRVLLYVQWISLLGISGQ